MHHLQATVTMATAEKRFHVPSEEDIDKDSINTVVDVAFKCLRQRSNGLKICLPAVFLHVCVFLVSFGIIKHL
jgi:hypothetical protein